MHEQAIAKNIIGKATQYGRVKAITVEVGDLAHLPLEEMESVLKTMTPWKINMIRKIATISCDVCGVVGRPNILEKGHDHNIYECHECKSKMPRIIDGHDIVLKDVEVE